MVQQGLNDYRHYHHVGTTMLKVIDSPGRISLYFV